jgi:hypothetical protein
MTLAYFWQWLGAFAFTQAVEIPIYMRPLTGRFMVAFGASALTHPVLWFVFPRIHAFQGDYWYGVGCAEGFAVVVEAVWIFCFGVRPALQALMWSILANGMSFGLGLVSRYYFNFP